MRALEMRLMVRWLPRAKGLRVLDVGCGHGLYSLPLATRSAWLMGCDLAAHDVANARRVALGLGLGERATYLVADGAHLPTSDERFDVVMSNCVLEHILNDRAALEGMVRSLRPGGLLLLTVDNAEHALALRFLERLPRGFRARLLRPELLASSSLSAGIDARIAALWGVRRRYHLDHLAASLSSLGLTVLGSTTYLSGIGAAQYEAFFALKGLDQTRGLGRVLYALSSLLLYPLAVWSDRREGARGHGLAIVARKGSESPSAAPA
jgi:SAM-dependent methyltransferase